MDGVTSHEAVVPLLEPHHRISRRHRLLPGLGHHRRGRWLRDLNANSVAIITFPEPAEKLRVFSEVNVDLYDELLIECHIDPRARSFPFQYSANEQLGLIPYRMPSYPHDGPALQKWLSELDQPGQLIDTLELLNKLNTRIFESLKYQRREDPGVQLPSQTIALGGGSCRDYAVLMMEAARS